MKILHGCNALEWRNHRPVIFECWKWGERVREKERERVHSGDLQLRSCRRMGKDDEIFSRCTAVYFGPRHSHGRYICASDGIVQYSAGESLFYSRHLSENERKSEKRRWRRERISSEVGYAHTTQIHIYYIKRGREMKTKAMTV